MSIIEALHRTDGFLQAGVTEQLMKPRIKVYQYCNICEGEKPHLHRVSDTRSIIVCQGCNHYYDTVVKRNIIFIVNSPPLLF